MTTEPISAGPNDVTVRARFEQWYLRELRGNPANLELEESGEYKYLSTLFLAFEAGEKIEREACAKVCDGLAKKYDESFDPVEDLTCQECAQAIRERSN